jgi:hypothetical protein
MRRKFGIFALVLGVLLVAGAGVVRWVVAPQLAQLPSDTNTTRMYSGTAAELFNPTITTGTRIGPGVLHNVPIEVKHNDRVIATDGHSALVVDQRVVTVPGYTVADLSYRYGVDRRTFMPVDTFPGVVDTTGVTFNWPMDTQKRDYTGFVQDTLQPTTLRFAGAVRHAGVETYKFQTSGPAAVITDRVLGRMLPDSMTKQQLLEVTPSLGLTKPQMLKLDTLMTTLPDPVPLTYTYTGDATFYVAPASGVVVDMTQHDVRTSGVMVSNQFVPLSNVMDMTYAFSPATVTGAVGDARKAISDLHKIRVVAPLALLVTGGAFLLVGLALVSRRRQQQPPLVYDDALGQLLKPREHIGV